MIHTEEIKPLDAAPQVEELKVSTAFKLDLACGNAKAEGFHGVDILGAPETQADTVHDFKSRAPWPFASDSVDEARCSHFFEHLDGKERVIFMNELYRVLKPGAGCLFHTPLGYDRQVQDPTHAWPPVVAATYLYFDVAWLKANNLQHYIPLLGINCDFEIRPLQASVHPSFTGRNDEFKIFAVEFYRNGAQDLTVLAVKKKS